MGKKRYSAKGIGQRNARAERFLTKQMEKLNPREDGAQVTKTSSAAKTNGKGPQASGPTYG